MNIEEIALKIDILERQNLSKSAEITNYTQSALTSKVKKMEAEIGQEVFKRTPQGLKITNVGTQYLKFLKLITQEYDEFLQEIGSAQTTTKINFGTSHTTIKIYGASIMNALQTNDIPLDVDFTVESSTSLNEKTHHAEMDCALTSNPIKHYPDLNYDMIATETFEVISNNSHIINFEKRSPVTLLVLSRGCMYTRAMVEWLKKYQVPFTMKEIKSVSSILDFLQIDNTIAVLNTKLIDLYNYSNIHYYDLQQLNKVIETVFIYKKNESQQSSIFQLKHVIESLLEDPIEQS
ncbi:LysR family transcriptional regulator [Lysinibacillus sp. FJAT-14745]|uniref:LysR family transcriptional regulator n=1 Tax=Lysinibacillus sp. FJAT-14745 TaxID=1704289 RepID=UPI0006ABCC3A|nr:LysR family transcriptional regulator [Lysinibacillus sp. FJAT-14745]KOP80832.1 LysR family transcriptional regulator [Lysinibacillus sp. FJAT-14745]